MNKRFTRPTMLGIAAVTAASLALVGCASDEAAASKESAAREASSTTSSTAAPAAEPEPLSWSPEGEPPGAQRIDFSSYDVTAGDVITVTATGFAPNVSLGSGFVGVWPPSGVPDADHLPSYIPDVVTTDATGAATLDVEIHDVCGKGDCFLSVADGIGFNAWYAARQLNYVG